MPCKFQKEETKNKIRKGLFGNTNRRLKIGEWSEKYDKCIKCETTERIHEAKGLCVKCYKENGSYKSAKTKTGFRYADAPTPRANVCEICNREGKTVLDHNHSNNKFRGWLCSQCNTSLGLVKDRIEILHKMIEYLVKNS